MYHNQEIYTENDWSLYQVETSYHQTYPHLMASPHFIRDDGVVIHLQLKEGDISEDLVHISMEIFGVRSAILSTIHMLSDFGSRSLETLNEEELKHCYSHLSEKNLEYDPEITREMIASSQQNNKKFKNSGQSENSFGEIPRGFVPFDWISASKTRNYALKNTLVDWLDQYYDGSPEARSFSNGKHKNEEYDFPKFLMGKGISFEENVISLIKSKVKKNEFVTICSGMKNFYDKITEYEHKTIAEINKRTPIIYQPVLLNRSGNLVCSYGIPDLLVREDYLGKIVQDSPLDKPRKNSYVVVDIKFSTLDLCADGKRIRNSGSVPAYKCQLYIYNHALGKIQGHEPRCAYILGRKCKYETRGKQYSENSCFARLGHIEYNQWDKKYIGETVRAIEWIRRLRTEGREWKLLPTPSVPELYPNMSTVSESPWDNVKYEYAKKIGDVTLLWNCGAKNQKIAHENGIYSYTDPDCNAHALGINGPKQAPVLDWIIGINKQTDFDSAFDRICINLNEKIDNMWAEETELRISVDFETIGGIFDDFTDLPLAQDQAYLFMIGVGYQYGDEPLQYHMFLATELSLESEYQMIRQFYQFLRQKTDDYLGADESIPPLYHWGHIEKSFFAGICKKIRNKIQSSAELLDVIEPELDWFDLLTCFKENPIVINGCFKFGLKEIAHRLYELGLIKHIWKGNNPCANGNMAMIMSQKAYQSSRTTQIPIDQNPIIEYIQEYNRIDCWVIHDIINLLRKKMESM